MNDENEVFTITLIVDGDNSKLLLSTSETPAKEDSEASGVLYKEDLPEQFEEIVSKIPIFKTAMEEDGSEESITHTVDEFSNLYDLDLIQVIEAGEEILHVDLDDDNESEEDEKHNKEVFNGDDSDLSEFGDRDSNPDPFDIYRDESPNKEDAMSHIDPREALGNF